MLLNVHTVYSLLESTLQIDEYVKIAASYGYQAIGIADINVLHAAYQFYQTASKHDLKPLIGMTLDIAGLYTRDQRFPLIIYAKNLTGYQHLIKISRLVNQPNRNDQNVWDYLQYDASGLVMITAGKNSELEQALIYENQSLAVAILETLNQIFGKDNVYLGLQIYPFNQLELNVIQGFANKHGLKKVINQLVNVLKSDQAFSLKVLQAIGNNSEVDASLMNMKSGNYLYSLEELQQLYMDHGLENCISQTEQLIQELNVVFPEDTNYLPKYTAPNSLSSDEYLRVLTSQSLEKMQIDNKDIYKERLEHELNVISEMGFSDYFLLVWEIVTYCHNNDIRIGPGRGSAVGSLVSYLLRITALDPIEYDLLFERFLNPERYNMPDIDIDIIDSKRDQVLNFLAEKYGYNQVAQIVTFGTFAAKSAVRDTLRVLNHSSAELKEWSNAIPNELNIQLQSAFDQSATLRKIVMRNEDNQKIFQIAKNLEGIPRHISTHAAAIIINDFELDRVIPVLDRSDQLMLTQFSMYEIENLGLLKMDFLGLRNLQILDDIVKAVKLIEPNFDIETIPMDDQATLNLFKEAKTNGIFQFESSGMKNVLKQLQPDNFEDIVAINALFRPGPMKQIEHYRKRKTGEEKYDYIHPILEPILAKTYGIIVYQEQVMQVCQTMAGFSLGQADILRRAMGKKQVDVMERERENFIQGSLANGISQEIAERTYAYIYEFASYGFNRSHAVAYSFLAYQLAYLKAYYPLNFYLSILNTGKADLNYLTEAKQVTGKILGIDINYSQLRISIHQKQLQLGFESIKHLPRDFIHKILSERQSNGPFKDFIQFLRRLNKKYLDKKVVEPLILTGAFDQLGYNRHTLVENLESLIKNVQFSGGNISLFQELEPRIDWQEEYSFLELIAFEKDILGFSSIGHPLDAYNDWFKDPTYTPLDEILELKKKSSIKTIAMVNEVKVIQTKNNEPMAFVTVANESIQLILVVFPNIWHRSQILLKENNIIEILGKVDLNRRNEVQIIANQVQPINSEKDNGNDFNNYTKCFIRLLSQQDHFKQIEKIKELATLHPGPCKIIVSISANNNWELTSQYNISYSFSAQEKLQKYFGIKNVVFR